MKAGHRVILTWLLAEQMKEMVAPATVDPLIWLRMQLEEAADADLVRELVRRVAEAMCADADAVCGAASGERGDRLQHAATLRRR
jgi:hypothetical protein